MQSYPSIHGFLQERLTTGVSNILNGWYDRLTACGYQDPRTGWFYPGTVRAVVAGQIQRAVASRSQGRWLVLTEQPYPESTPEDRTIIDIWLQGPAAEHTVAIMIRADFDLDQAQMAYQNLATMTPRKFDYGYLVFCAEKMKLADWEEEIETNVHDRVCARGISCKTGSEAHHSRRRRQSHEPRRRRRPTF